MYENKSDKDKFAQFQPFFISILYKTFYKTANIYYITNINSEKKTLKN